MNLTSASQENSLQTKRQFDYHIYVQNCSKLNINEQIEYGNYEDFRKNYDEIHVQFVHF